MKKMKKFLGIMLAMVMAVTMLAGCGGSSKESSSSDNGKTLKFGCFSYSESLDPANMINSAWCNSRYGIGECLFKYKDDLSVENTICDEYSTEDNKTWVFHILLRSKHAGMFFMPIKQVLLTHLNLWIMNLSHQMMMPVL